MHHAHDATCGMQHATCNAQPAKCNLQHTTYTNCRCSAVYATLCVRDMCNGALPSYGTRAPRCTMRALSPHRVWYDSRRPAYICQRDGRTAARARSHAQRKEGADEALQARQAHALVYYCVSHAPLCFSGGLCARWSNLFAVVCATTLAHGCRVLSYAKAGLLWGFFAVKDSPVQSVSNWDDPLSGYCAAVVLHVARCVLRVVCCMLHAKYCMRHAGKRSGSTRSQ